MLFPSFKGTIDMGRSADRIATLSVAVFSFLLAPAAMAADQVRVPGTRVALQPPEGFAPSRRFSGFEHTAQGASIVVTEVPAAYAEMRTALTRDGLASRGMKLIAGREVSVDGANALLVHVSQSAGGVDFLKWMLLARGGADSVLVVGTFPRAAPAAFGDQVRDAVLSTSLKPADKVDAMEGLPFALEPGSRLKIARRMGNMLLLNRSGTMMPAAAGEPLYVVGASLSEVAIGDLQRFAEQRARQTAEIANLRSLSGRRLKVDGLDAYEIVADASDLRSGQPLRFYQAIALDGGGYFMFQGLAGVGSAAEYVGEFRRLTDSFRRLPPTQVGTARDAR